MDTYLKKGKAVGRALKPGELSQEEIESLTPMNLRGQKFDGEKAKQTLTGTAHKNVEKSAASKIDPAIEAALQIAGQAFKPWDELLPVDSYEETSEKCKVEFSITPITLNHALSVEVIHHSQKNREYKKCKGHHEEKKSDDSHKDKKKKEKKLASDPSIESFNVTIDSNSHWFHRDVIVSNWTHKDDMPNCSSFTKEKETISEEKWEESDRWIMDRPDLLNSLNCTLVNTTFGASETRSIEGKEFTRPYWSKTQHLQCLTQKQSDCDFIMKKNCLFSSETCVKKSGDQCLIWEKIFKCRTRTTKEQPELKGIFGSDSNLWDKSYQENQEFSDIATKLAIFDEMKNELQNTNATDIRTVHLFSGTHQQCSKSIAADIMYDCCFDMDGLAIDVKLSKCTADEIALAESRRKGLCHYIGVRKEKFLELWVSRKEHVFCVFPSKLSRVFQEEARKQLAISWGDPDRPDCRGLTQEEIKKLDFSTLNLLEAFETPKQVDSQEKINNIENRLKQRIEGLFSCK